MKKIVKTHLAISIALLMVSCGKELNDSESFGTKYEYEAVKSELDAKESSFSIDGIGQKISIHIVCNSYWKAETKADWLELEKSEGKGNTTLSVNVLPNPSVTSQRKEVITVTDGLKTIVVSVTQAASTEKLILNETSLSFPYGGLISDVSVDANSEWTVTSDASWCRAEKHDGKLRVVADYNNSYSPRSATVTVKGIAATATISVTQAAPQEPTMGDLQITNIAKTSVDCKFTYSSSDLYIKRRGVCYSTTNKAPTTSDDRQDFTNSSSTAYFGTSTHSLTGLKQNTTYYIRPFVTTVIDTSYGKTVTFTTTNSNSPNEGDNPPPSY